MGKVLQDFFLSESGFSFANLQRLILILRKKPNSEMLRKFKDVINHLIVLIKRKSDSSRKTFYELEQMAYRDSAAFMYEKMNSAVLFTDLHSYWDYSFKQILPQGYMMEFGVFSGLSINYFSSILSEKKDQRTIYGFDSFEGLSEAWGGTKLGKGHFNVSGNLPKVNLNVQLVKGWIQDTFPDFVSQHNLDENKVSFIHIDVDTYYPSRIILENAQAHFVPGTIIIFDELFGYPGWRAHEFKALTETVDPYWDYEYIAFCEIQRRDYTSEHMRTAIRILARK